MLNSPRRRHLAGIAVIFVLGFFLLVAGCSYRSFGGQEKNIRAATQSIDTERLTKADNDPEIGYRMGAITWRTVSAL